MLAGNLPITILHADPSEIMDAGEAAAKLAPFLDQYDQNNLRKLLTKKTRYVELDRQLTPKRHANILRLGIPGIYFAEGAVRIYPRDHAAAHILGHVDTENNGIAGIEKSMHSRLASGKDVTLSIDLGLQSVIRSEIQKQKLINSRLLAVLAFYWTSKLVKCLLSPRYLISTPTISR